MRIPFFLLTICMLALLLCACKKNGPAATGCDPLATTTRKIIAKRATVKLTATATYPIYLVEEGAIDTKLIPCNYPSGAEYYQHNLQVIITGDVKPVANASDYGPCCSENLVISLIVK